MSPRAPADAFAAVLGAGRGQAAVPGTGSGSTTGGERRIVTTDLLAEFVGCCSAVLEVVLGEEDAPVVLEGNEFPASMYKAYLMFLACGAPDSDDFDVLLDSFCERLHPDVWELLGFRHAPDRFELELAFAAFVDFSYLESELRAFTTGIELFAASGVFQDLSR